MFQMIDSAFYHVSEKERTKHVHRVQPYLGKFIPQLVEYFVKKEFTSKDILLDPFMGSATTLVVASEMGIGSIGIDVSEFNCMIAKAKLCDYDLEKVGQEIKKIYQDTQLFSEGLTDQSIKKFELPKANEYLNTWFAKKSILELLFYSDAIEKYKYQDVLRIILARSARSSRLVHHYDIATPKKPVTDPYVCRKHQDKICSPIDHAIGKIRLYSFDTINRLIEFSQLRKSRKYLVLHGDSRFVNILEKVREEWDDHRQFINGVFTSPPYVGQIDYHEQHRYAYELFNIPRNDDKEIGPKKEGKGRNAQIKYQNAITDVFKNVKKSLSDKAKVFIVANDRFNLYPKIIDDSGLQLINVEQRPVEARSEGDKTPYSESIFECTLNRLNNSASTYTLWIFF